MRKLSAGVGLTVDKAGNFNAFDLLHKDVKRLNAQTQKSTNQLRKLNKQSAGSSLSLLGLDKNVNRASQSIGRLTNVIGIGGGVFAAWRLGTRADELRLLESRVARVTEVTGDYVAVNEELNRIAFDNGLALKGTADLFINIQRAAADLGKTNAESLQLTNTVQQLGVISGASYEAMKNSLRQFSQAMAGGIVRAEEWNSIVENTPEIANRIAQGMGKTIGQLRLMVIEGKVLSEDVFDTLLSQTNSIQADFDKMPLTLQRASSQLNQNFDKVLDVINKSTNATGGFANAMSLAAVQLGELTAQDIDDGLSASFGVIGIAAAVMGARVVASGAKFAGTKISNIKAANAESLAVINANLAAARSQQVRSTQLLNSATTARTAAVARANLARANSVLAISEVNAARATGLFTGSVVRSTVATGVLAGTTGLLRNSMALVGGPAGVIALAAFAAGKYFVELDKTTEGGNRLVTQHEFLTQSFAKVEEFTRKSSKAGEDNIGVLIKQAEATKNLALSQAESSLAQARVNQTKASIRFDDAPKINGNLLPADAGLLLSKKQADKEVLLQIAGIKQLKAEYADLATQQLRQQKERQFAIGKTSEGEAKAALSYRKSVEAANDLLAKTVADADKIGKTTVELFKQSDAYRVMTASQRESHIARLEEIEVNKTSKGGVKGLVTEFDKLSASMQGTINKQTLSQVEQVKLTTAYKEASAENQLLLERQARRIDLLDGEGKSATNTVKSNNELTASYNGEIASLDRRELALTSNTNELLKYDLAQKTFGKNQLTYTQVQIDEIVNRNANIVSLEKEKKKREDATAATKAAHESIRIENEERATGITLIKGLTVAESKAEAVKKKLWAAQDKFNDSVKDASKFVKDLAKSNKVNEALQKSGLKLTVEQYKQYQLLNEEGRKQLLIENEKAKIFEKNNKLTELYNDRTKDLNKELAYKILLNTRGRDAANLAYETDEYGNAVRAKTIRGLKDQISEQDKLTESWDNLGNTIFESITKGVDLLPELEAGLRKVSDSLIDAVGKSGSFGEVFKNVGSLYSSAGGIGGAVSNFQTGSQLTSLFSDDQATQIGGGIGSAIGNAILPGVGGAVGNVLGSIVGGLFGSDLKDVTATFGDITSDRLRGGGVYASGRNETGQNFERGSILQERFGLLGRDADGSHRTVALNRDEEGQIEAVMALLDGIKVLDDSLGSILSDTDIANVQNSLSTFTGDALDPDQLLKERFTLVGQALDPLLTGLIDFSVSGEELANRIAFIVDAANVAVPLLKDFGLNIGIGEQAIAASVGLIELSGGLDNLAGLRSNYLDQVLTDEKKLLNTREAHQSVVDGLNSQLGLTGNATINTVQGLQMLVTGLETSGELTTLAGQESLIAAYASADAFAYLAAEQQALNDEIQLLATTFNDFGSPLSLINAGSFEAQQGLVGLAGGISNLSGLMSGYISNILTEDEQKIYAQVSAAQQLQQLAADIGIDANLLDTRDEFKQLVSDANNAKLLSTEAGQENLVKLLEASGAVATLADSGQSLINVLSTAPEDILNFTGAASISDEFESVNNELSNTVGFVDEAVESFNNIIAPDFKNDLQEQLSAQKEANRLQAENNIIQRSNQQLLQSLQESNQRIASDSSYNTGAA